MKKYAFILVTLSLIMAAIATVSAVNKPIKQSPRDITVGTVITLQPYDANIIPPQVVNYDAATIATVTAGDRYRVVANRVIYVGNESFGVVDVKAVYSYTPIQTISWPAYYTKIAFTGGISKSSK